MNLYSINHQKVYRLIIIDKFEFIGMNNKGNLIDEARIQDLIKKDRTIVFYGNSVLDVTDFNHPGPNSVILDSIGKDLKIDFDVKNHSSFAKSLL